MSTGIDVLPDKAELLPGFSLMSFSVQERARPGLLLDGVLHDLCVIAQSLQVAVVEGSPCFGILDILADWDRAFERLQLLVSRASQAGLDPALSPINDASFKLLSPVPKPGKMIHAAQNYQDHVEEMRHARVFGFNDSETDPNTDFTGDRATTRPYLFLKAPSCVTGPYDDVIIPPEVTQMDWEVELAVVIGRKAKRVNAGDALDHVAGYMTINDFSARNLLFRPDRDRLRSDWFGGKSHDGFAPMGPVLMPASFVPDHRSLPLRLTVNGEVKQNGNTSGLIFSAEEQIEFASAMTTLEPGDVLATGTPGGVGQGSDNFLKSGDLVEAEVEGIGVLRNRVI